MWHCSFIQNTENSGGKQTESDLGEKFVCSNDSKGRSQFSNETDFVALHPVGCQENNWEYWIHPALCLILAALLTEKSDPENWGDLLNQAQKKIEV